MRRHSKHQHIAATNNAKIIAHLDARVDINIGKIDLVRAALENGLDNIGVAGAKGHLAAGAIGHDGKGCAPRAAANNPYGI